MAYSPSPQHSPTMAGIGNGRLLVEQPIASAAAPVPTISKRDKRRNLLSNQLNELTTSFANNRDVHYRQQLQALQIDLNLIMRANPYKDIPLDDSGEEVHNLSIAAIGGNSHVNINGMTSASRHTDLDVAALAGRWYAQYVEEVNDAVELRDTHLTMLENRYKRALYDIQHHNTYKIRLAQEEHRSLAHTLRERLIQSVGQRKARLMREKEQLDIADSNALLLHPSQFSITHHPASPSNLNNHRKTRHTRHRPELAAGDETSTPDNNSSHKRKRKTGPAPFEDVNDSGSPAEPLRGAFELSAGGTASPFRDARQRTAATQSEAPLYSVERLFTEKELQMNLNHAHVAAHNYFTVLKVAAANNGQLPGANSPSKTSSSHNPSSAVDDGDAPIPTDDDDDPSVASHSYRLVAPEMDRTLNSSHHATRSTRGNHPNLNNSSNTAALNVLVHMAAVSDNAAAAGTNKLILPSSHITKTLLAPPPPALRVEEVEYDLRVLEMMKAAGKGQVDERLLRNLVSGTNTGTAAATGGVAMSAQSSLAEMSYEGFGTGMAGLGGVAMSRVGEGSSLGVTMKRRASGAGMSGGAAEMKRAKKA